MKRIYRTRQIKKHFRRHFKRFGSLTDYIYLDEYFNNHKSCFVDKLLLFFFDGRKGKKVYMNFNRKKTV
jgi:hypothetical protein